MSCDGVGAPPLAQSIVIDIVSAAVVCGRAYSLFMVVVFLVVRLSTQNSFLLLHLLSDSVVLLAVTLDNEHSVLHVFACGVVGVEGLVCLVG